MWNWKKTGLLISALIILAAVFAGGIYVGIGIPAESKILKVLGKAPPTPLPEDVDFSPFWQAWNIVETKYVDIAKTKRQDMVYGAISGLLKSLGDPYSVFFTPQENQDFQSEVKGEFEGVGMEIGIRKGILTVIAPLKGTPAERAGIKSGDKILKIGDTDSADLTIEEAVHLIRGPKGTKIKLVISRNAEDVNRTIEVARDVINIPIIDTESNIASSPSGSGQKNTVDLGNIFVIRLYNFSENSPQEFRSALRQMVDEKKTKLILDLRNNPGGYLDAAVDIASWFLPQGDVVVQEDFGNKADKMIHRSRGYNIFNKLPMVILVNQGSASASEILAGALRDHGIAKLIGEKTYGKGSVQELLPLTSDTSIKITIAKWLTPNGLSISEKGLDPDIEIKPTDADTKAGKDPVMDKAIEIVKDMQ